MKLGNKKHYKTFFSSGFTLVEVLLSVTILTIGIIGSISLIGYNINAVTHSVNRLMASNLAQDGFELVRGVRDTNWLQGKTAQADNDPNSWRSSIQGIGSEMAIKFFCSGIYKSNIEIASINNCNGTKCNIYKFTKKNGEIDAGAECYSEWDNSWDTNAYNKKNSAPLFERLINIQKIQDYEILVTVTIRWTERGQYQYVVLKGSLFNWRN